jgi:hypothetical protein
MVTAAHVIRISVREDDAFDGDVSLAQLTLYRWPASGRSGVYERGHGAGDKVRGRKSAAGQPVQIRREFLRINTVVEAWFPIAASGDNVKRRRPGGHRRIAVWWSGRELRREVAVDV